MISAHAPALHAPALVSQAVRCGDDPTPARELKVAPKLWPFRDVQRIESCALQANVEVGEHLRLTVTSGRIGARAFGLTLDAAAELGEVLKRVPAVKATEGLRALRLRGPVRVSMDVQMG